MQALKKIWITEAEAQHYGEPAIITPHKEIPYIRADLVDELVGALEGLLDSYLWERESHWGPNDYEEDECVIKTRTALAKIKEKT